MLEHDFIYIYIYTYMYLSLISGLWGILKMRVCSRRGQVSSRLPEFLHEFSYRHLHAINGNIYVQLLCDISV